MRLQQALLKVVVVAKREGEYTDLVMAGHERIVVGCNGSSKRVQSGDEIQNSI